MSQPRITIVTPCYNSERFLEETILSVLDQGWENLEYIIVDGGSTDGTLDIIRKYEEHLSAWVSESDEGMYDAINKGFKLGTGEIYAWINSDDTYLPGAFFKVAGAFERHPHILWITGKTIYSGEDGKPESSGPLLMYNRNDIEKGRHGLWLDFIQQNCCFWKASLWEKCTPIPAELKYAGDYWLWIQFARHTELMSVDVTVASFRRHGAQLSVDVESYYNEVWKCVDGVHAFIRLRKLMRKLFRIRSCLSQFIGRFYGGYRYCWMDPQDDYEIKETRYSQIPGRGL